MVDGGWWMADGGLTVKIELRLSFSWASDCAELSKITGLAAINQIMSMLNLTSLGHFYFEIALILRDTILISKLEFNSEIWYNVSKKQIEKLQQIDETYLRKIFDVAKSWHLY